MEFFEALRQHSFLQLALVTGLLVSVASGVTGTYVVARRISYIAAAISHCVLGGMGAARYVAVSWGWSALTPLHGALAAALLSAVLIGWVTLRAKQREDTVIGAIWALGMAIGVLFIAKTPGYGEDLMGYLFGNILMVGPRDLWLIAGLDVVVLGTVVLFYNRFLAVCFDEEFARLRGINVELNYLLLLCLVALTVVLLVVVVGIVLVIALLTLPIAIASHFTRTMSRLMLLSCVLSAALCTLGLALSYSPNLPPGATMVVLAGAGYLVTALGSRVVKPLWHRLSSR